jgi:adenosine deaminase
MKDRNDLAEFIAALPKAELHVHLEGSIPAADAARLAQKIGVELPGLVFDPAIEGLYRYQVRDFSEFIRLYIALSSCLTDADQVLAMIDGVAASLAAQNVRWVELTVTPLTHVRRGFDENALLEALGEGRSRALAKYGLGIGWVFDVVRAFPDQGEETLDLALRGRDLDIGVVALGVGGPEGVNYPGAPLAATFARAYANELPAVPHAGEQMGAASVWEAVRLFKAERIGHGFRSIEDPALLDHLRENDICLEICPTSNLALVGVHSLAEHPLPKLLAAGVPVVIASDDPPLVGTTLSAELQKCARAYSWSLHEVARRARASFEYALMPTAQRVAQLLEFDECVAKLLPDAVSPAVTSNAAIGSERAKLH